jgi:dolichol-phosphate mannosyltransferase
MKKISVVVPVYHNEGSLPALFAELVKVEGTLQPRDLTLELIFVDDGSGDGSWRALLEIKRQRAQTKLIKLTRNFGAMHALKAALPSVTGDCFVFLAADLQDPPYLILEMIERWQNGAKYVICARTRRADPLSARVFAGIYYRLLRWIVARDYPAQGYDLALMDKAFLPYLQGSSKNINIPLFAYWLGFNPTLIEYERQERVFGRSRWTFSKRLKFFLDSLLGFSIVPIRIISAIGLLVSAASFGYGLLVLVNALLGRADVRGFSALAALISFLLGLVIVMLGVIGEYLWRIFDEVNKRPEAVIDEVV